MKSIDKKFNYKDIKILYEDNHLIVCIKPEGILSQEDSSKDPDMLTLLKEYIKDKYNKPGDVYLGLVHRLDRRVGGVMVFCKTSKAASRISKQIREGVFDKKYICVCCGKIEGTAVLENNLTKTFENIAIEDEEGKKCKLEYSVINHFKIDENDFSVLLVKLYTGRFNQIRKQMSIINHPLINDFKYGYRLPNYGDSLGLRCVEISFNHPITKERLVFKSQGIESNSSWVKYMEY